MPRPPITRKIIVGDSLTVLKALPDASIHCCITSPPYWGLRDYGTATWHGGSAKCDHLGNPFSTKVNLDVNTGSKKQRDKLDFEFFKKVCGKCGARRVDSQLGLEWTPEEYVAKMVDVFREVRRVLRKDGTLWLNLGDSYGSTGNNNGTGGNPAKRGWGGSDSKRAEKNKLLLDKKTGLSPKNLIGIPWQVAFALRADGWNLRQDIIWHKPNPTPESVTDRCTKSHEYIFLMTKSSKYWYDADAIKDLSRDPLDPNKRNKGSVWTVSLKPFKEAHFAVFPLNLIRPCILAGCPMGGTILDPFLGSGTTAIGATIHSRGYVGIELNPVYAKMAEARLEKVRKNMAKDGVQDA
jgi:DNA modification methylase